MQICKISEENVKGIIAHLDIFVIAEPFVVTVVVGVDVVAAGVV